MSDPKNPGTTPPGVEPDATTIRPPLGGASPMDRGPQGGNRADRVREWVKRRGTQSGGPGGPDAPAPAGQQAPAGTPPRAGGPGGLQSPAGGPEGPMRSAPSANPPASPAPSPASAASAANPTPGQQLYRPAADTTPQPAVDAETTRVTPVAGG
ncbi:MAG: hypothetical protein Q4F67_01755, partial [Propionibacteriaceae bacterium]|nr:hypothetical protein [Propionibacteriaceae bacterium]